MKTKLSSKGQIVLPEAIRKKLGMVAGESLEVTVEEGRVILTRNPESLAKAQIGVSGVTGMPILSVPKGSLVLTSEQVAALLADFP